MTGLRVDEFEGRKGTDPLIFSRTRHFAFHSDAGRMRIESVGVGDAGARLFCVRSTGHEVALTEETHLNVLVPLRGRIDVATTDADYAASAEELLVFSPNERRTVVIPDAAGVYEALLLAVPFDRWKQVLKDPRDFDGAALSARPAVRVLATELSRIVATLRLRALAGLPGTDLGIASARLEDRLADVLGHVRGPAALSPSAGSLRQLRLAEDFIRANAGAPLRMEDIGAAAGVSVRALQATFRRHRGITPHQALTRLRLEGVRLRLLGGGASDRVTDVALQWGFTHLGRFSQVYAARFGESPSATLRRAQSG